MGLIICSLAFLAAFAATWRSLASGLASVLTAGYFFGILRANFPDTFSHFIFDSAVLGFYLAFFGQGGPKKSADPRQESLRRWVSVLIGWGVLMFLVPIQHPLIQLVGLRGNVFLLPFILAGARLERDAANGTVLWLCILNQVALAFAVAEYVLGVQKFYPENPITELIYRSGDAAGGNLRIPAIFSNAHSYGGTMVFSMPWLLGAWVQPSRTKLRSLFLLSGMAAAMVGVFFCAARIPVIMLGIIVVAATFSGHLRGASWLAWAVMLLGIGYIVSGEERMQRFMTLEDAEQVVGRVHISVNMSFVDLLVTYPFGNGMGAGGTSVPYFLQHLVRDPVAMENEYSRILLEQGVAGLVLWLIFICWFVARCPLGRRDPWAFGKILLWLFSLASFAFAMLGTGLMTAIPQSMIFFLGIGFVIAPAPAPQRPGRPKNHSLARSTPMMAHA